MAILFKLGSNDCSCLTVSSQKDSASTTYTNGRCSNLLWLQSLLCIAILRRISHLLRLPTKLKLAFQGIPPHLRKTHINTRHKQQLNIEHQTKNKAKHAQGTRKHSENAKWYKVRNIKETNVASWKAILLVTAVSCRNLGQDNDSGPSFLLYRLLPGAVSKNLHPTGLQIPVVSPEVFHFLISMKSLCLSFTPVFWFVNPLIYHIYQFVEWIQECVWITSKLSAYYVSLLPRAIKDVLEAFEHHFLIDRDSAEFCCFSAASLSWGILRSSAS